MHKIPVVSDFSGKFDSIQGMLELFEGVSSSMAECMSKGFRYEILPEIIETDHGFEIASVAISGIPAEKEKTCAWKKSKIYPGKYAVLCDVEHHFGEIWGDRRYCPYCGGKIVEKESD